MAAVNEASDRLKWIAPHPDGVLRREMLLRDFNYWGECFWKNEEAGERRVQFLITLVTAVMAGLVAIYQYSAPEHRTTVLLRVAPAALMGLLVVGLITFLRMVHRNRVTDQYKERADEVRRFIVGDEAFLWLYHPRDLVDDKKTRWWPAMQDYFEDATRSLSNGGFVVMVAALNSLLLGLFFGLQDLSMDASKAWPDAIRWFWSALFVQVAFAVWKDRRARNERKQCRTLRYDHDKVPRPAPASGGA